MHHGACQRWNAQCLATTRAMPYPRLYIAHPKSGVLPKILLLRIGGKGRRAPAAPLAGALRGSS
eukprot:12900538-Prorocentrum_lima.AAC.1